MSLKSTQRIKSKFLVGVGALAILTAGMSYSAHAQVSEAMVEFDLPAQDLAKSLKSYGVATDRQVMYAANVVRGKRANEVSGDLTPSAALDQLLDGSGLIYETTSSNVILVKTAQLETSAQRDGIFRVAQLVEGDDRDVETIRDRRESDDEEEKRDVIVVTGTHIRGTEASVGSKLTILSKDDIDLGGFGNVQEAIQSLPSVFRGGINQDSRSQENGGNRSGKVSINLRGLGAGSTLTLINGRRVAAGGLSNTVDVSSIPASLIKRVEVLADGASATYGSDAVAGVVNIILRDDFEGAETSLRFGTVTEGGSQEYRASQIFGANWETGHALISYEYYKRESLDFEDKPFSADSDLTLLGGDNFRRNFSVPGNIMDPATFFQTVAFAIPDGQDGTNLTPGDLLPGQVNLFNQNQGVDLLNDQKRHSVFATVSQELTDGIEIFAEGRFSDRDFQSRSLPTSLRLTVPATNPFFVDPFGGSASIRIQYNGFADFNNLVTDGNVRDYNAVWGVNIDLWKDWQLRAYGSYSGEQTGFNSMGVDFGIFAAALADPDPVTAFNPFGDGTFQQNPDTLNSIIVPSVNKGQSDLWSGNMVADGSLLELPGGPVKLAVGMRYDRYSKESLFDPGVAEIRASTFQREVVALFGELLLPIFGEDNSRAGLERLILTASVRYEDYDDVGSTTDPKFGLLWTPSEGLNIRGTYGTSFRAPDLNELDETGNFSFNIPVGDPLSATGSTVSLVLFGNNSGLQNETAETWTVGFDYSPPFVQGLTFDLAYYNVQFENRITNVANAALSILFEEDKFASAIVRNPSQNQIDEACRIGGPFTNIGFGTCGSPVGAILDVRLINTAVTKTDGLDFNVRYGVDAGNAGRFDFRFGGTYILTFDEAFGPGAPIVELVDTVRNPIGLRLRNSVSWSNQKGLSATAFLNYSDSYRDNISVPERKIESSTTIDLTFSYRTEDRLRSAGLNDTSFSLSVRNLFDTDPPFVNNLGGVGYDPENASPLGRFISFNITKKW